MNILCAGINHKIAPLEIRERFAIGTHELPDVLNLLHRIDGTAGAVVLSTCNRVEFYAATVCPARALSTLHDWLEVRVGTRARLYELSTPASIRHLFRVSCGLDSMVLGETEVLGQIKRAYADATGHGLSSRHLHKLFQNAFRVAKTVRSQTRITRGATSVSAVAVELAAKIFGELSGRHVMILGAGEVGERTARSLRARGARSVIVANRTFERAAAVASEIEGLAVHFDHWREHFQDIDILIGSTGAPHPVLTKEKLIPLLAEREQRPLFIIDLAVPRDIDPSVNDLDGVYLYDIDALQRIADASVDVRKQEIARCEEMIETEVLEYLRWLRAHGRPDLEHIPSNNPQFPDG